MALNFLGNIASKVLPEIANWGVSKLMGSNIAQGVGNRYKKLKKKKILGPVIQAVEDAANGKRYKNFKACKGKKKHKP